MTLTRAQAAARKKDRDRTAKITELKKSKDGWVVSTDDGMGFVLWKKDLGEELPPEVGDDVTVYSYKGWNIRGIDLRGEPLFYKTKDELDRIHEENVLRHEEESKKKFQKDRKSLDRKFAALPDVFQRRISWFRAWNPDFRWKNESYEMSVCVDAVLIADTMKTVKGVERFQKASYKKQREMVPGLYDGHSGNSFECAVYLAKLYLTDPLLVVAEHGALVPLVGCEDYGCAHPRPDDVLAAIERFAN